MAPTKQEPADQDVPISSVGWLFIQKYYSTYTQSTDKLFALYDKDAALLHENFSSDSGRTMNSAKGTDAIKTFFAGVAEPAHTNKVVVERAHIQESVAGSILIVVSGSWKQDDASLKPFVQTFVLRAKERTVFDVANDVLEFVDDGEAKTTVEVTEPSSEVAEEKEEAETKADTKVEESPKTEPIKAESTEPLKTESEKTEAEPESEVAETPEPQAETEEKIEESGDRPKPTWANLAAIEPKLPAKSAAVAAAKAVAPPPKKPTPPSVTPPANNGRYKREEWFPIYIKNVEVEDEELRSALVKQFGEIKFFRRTTRTALCDFRNKEDQQKALDAKEIVVRGNTILLEPRLQKVFKVDPKKEKKPVKKPLKKA